MFAHHVFLHNLTCISPLFAAEKSGEKAQLEKIFRYIITSMIIYYLLNQEYIREREGESVLLQYSVYTTAVVTGHTKVNDVHDV